MMRNPYATRLIKEIEKARNTKKSESTSLWQEPNYQKLRHEERERQKLENEYENLFCTLIERDESLVCNTPYYDPIYKNKIIHDYKRNSSDEDIILFFTELLIKANEVDDQEKILFHRLFLKEENNFDSLSKDMKSYLSLIQKQFTYLEFRYAALKRSPEQIDFNSIKQQELLDTTKSDVFSIINKLYQLSFEGAVFSNTYSDKNHIFRRELFSILETLHFSELLLNVPGLQEYCFESHILTQSLSRNYLRGYLGYNDVTFNISYFQQLLGEILESMKIFIDGEYGKSSQEKFSFGLSSTLCEVHLQFATACFITRNHASCLNHIEKSLEYITTLIECLFDNLDISQFKIGVDIANVSLVPNMLEPEEFSSINRAIPRLDIIQKKHTALGNLLDTFINKSILVNNYLRDQVSRINKQITAHKKLIAQKQQEIVRREKETASKNVTLKQFEKKNNESCRPSKAPYVALPGLTFNPLPPQPQLPDIRKPEPTIRIPETDQLQNKKLKEQEYEKFIAQATESKTKPDEKNEFSSDFSLFAKFIVKISLDVDASTDERFVNALPKLKAIIDRGLITSCGQGIKLVPNSEKYFSNLDRNQLWFKLKPAGDLGNQVRVYGHVFKEDGEYKIIFNVVRLGNIHSNRPPRMITKKQEAVTINRRP